MSVKVLANYGRDFGFKESIFGSDTYGHDVKAFGDTTGCYMLWDASTNTFCITETLAKNPGASVIPFNVTITHSAGAGDCDDLVSGYFKAQITGSGDSGLTSVGLAARAYQGIDGSNAVASQVYGMQTWAKHDGTGAVTAMSGLSALVDVNTGAFTASTVNAGHFHIEGAGTVTGQFDGVMVEVYPDVTCLDGVLALAVDTGATVGSLFRISGVTSNFFDIAAATTCVVVAAGTTMHHDPNAVTCDGHLIIKIGATQYDIPFYDHA